VPRESWEPALRERKRPKGAFGTHPQSAASDGGARAGSVRQTSG